MSWSWVRVIGSAALVITGSYCCYTFVWSRSRPKEPHPNARKITTLPILDLQDSEEVQLRCVRKACQKHGFFYVRHHSVPQKLHHAVIEQCRAVFAMPLHKKLEVMVDRNNRGFAPMTKDKPVSLLNTKSSKAKPITKESFFIGREIAEGSEENEGYLQGSNQWPDTSLCPGFKSTIGCYFDEMWDLGLQLTEILIKSLGLDPRELEKAGLTDRPMLLLRLLHYDRTKSEPENGIFAANPHTDYGILTILANDDQPGLQLFMDNEWFEVPALEGCFVVNLGDMLERWTGGLYKSTLHRVLNTTGKDRYSVPFFFEPNVNCRIKSLLPDADDDGVLSGDHMKMKHEEAQSQQL